MSTIKKTGGGKPAPALKQAVYFFFVRNAFQPSGSERRCLFRPKSLGRFVRAAAPRPSGRRRVVHSADKVGFGSNLSPWGIPSAPAPLARSVGCEGSLDVVPMAGTT